MGNYKQIIRDYIRPTLGDIRLNELNSRHIQRFYNKKVSEGIGLRTVQKAHTIIHASLNSARKFGLIPYNPDDETNPPKPKPRAMKFLNQEQVRLFLESAKENDDRYYALYYLALVTGMRQGELLALKWENIDLEKGILNIKFNLKRLPNGGGLRVLNNYENSKHYTISSGNCSKHSRITMAAPQIIALFCFSHLFSGDFQSPSTLLPGLRRQSTACLQPHPRQQLDHPFQVQHNRCEIGLNPETE